jgi:hypothetical protein
LRRDTGLRRSSGRARGLLWLQKSTSSAWSRPQGRGSSPLARTLTRARSVGEMALEAGSRWRKPRAREQRNRWRAPRDPTRTKRKRGARPGEGALGDGRRSGPAEAAVFDETTEEGGPGDPKRRGCGLTAGSAEGRDRGRQRRRRRLGARSKTPRPGGAARRGHRSWPHQDRAVPLTWACGAEPP